MPRGSPCLRARPMLPDSGSGRYGGADLDSGHRDSIPGCSRNEAIPLTIRLMCPLALRSFVVFVRCCAVFICATAFAFAQVPPSAAEHAAYTGLFAAAALGDAAAVTQLAKQGADVKARDGYG